MANYLSVGRIRLQVEGSAGENAVVTRPHPRSQFAFTAFCGWFLLLIAVSAAPAQPQMFRQSRPAMGTEFTIYLYAPNQETASAQFEAAFEEIERVEEALSNYRASSELSRINRLAASEPVTTDPEVFELLRQSLAYASRSGGAFDITVGPLMRAWGFFRGQGLYPTETDLAAARAAVGYRHVALDSGARTVRFDRPGVELDLGGIGKGYVVDRVAELLRESGANAALINAGSSTLYALGAPPGRAGWRVRVPWPASRERTLSSVLLRDASLSTSGSYEKFFRLGGRQYCHIMNPHTGQPVQGMLQTTVIAPSATDSDVLSTAVFVMGARRGERLLRTIAKTSALWVEDEAVSPRVVGWRWPARMETPNQAEGRQISGSGKQ